MSIVCQPTAIVQSLCTCKIQVAPIQANTSVMLQLSWSFVVIFKFFVLSQWWNVRATWDFLYIWWCL